MVNGESTKGVQQMSYLIKSSTSMELILKIDLTEIASMAFIYLVAAILYSIDNFFETYRVHKLIAGKRWQLMKLTFPTIFGNRMKVKVGKISS